MDMLIVVILALVLVVMLVFLLRRKTVVTSSSILGRIERISELTTARLTVRHITEVSNLPILRSVLPIAMRNLVLVVPVSIRGYIDLRSLKSEDLNVSVRGDDSVSITLPSPKLEPAIPLPSFAEARVINQSGILIKLGDFIRGEDRFALIQRSMPQIEKEVREACLKDGLMETAQDSARNFFKGFLMGLGFSNVKVFFHDNDNVGAIEKPAIQG